MKITKAGITNSIIIIVIFSLTGVTTVYASALITNIFEPETGSLLYWIVYLLLILPLYHLLLFGYAFLFGRFDYFWGKTRSLLNRIAKLFS